MSGFLDRLELLRSIWQGEGMALGLWWLALGLLILSMAHRAPRTALWLAFVGIGGVALVGAKGALLSGWWCLAFFASSVMLWVVLSPLFLALGRRGEIALLTLFVLFWLGDLIRFAASLVLAVFPHLAASEGLLAWLLLVCSFFALALGMLPTRAWFRLFTLAWVGGLLVARGTALFWGGKMPTITEAPSFYLTALAGAFLVIWLSARMEGGVAQESTKKRFSYRGEPSDGWLEAYRPWSGISATHAFLIFFTILTIYPVLWVVKMAVTPTQGFSMGLNPIPQPLAAWWEASRSGQPQIAACYRRAMVQNFGEVTGLGSACLDQVCSYLRESGEKDTNAEKKAPSYRALCTPFLAAWSKPEKAARNQALKAWEERALASTQGEAPRRSMASLLRRIQEQHQERLAQRALFWRQLMNSVFVALITTLLGVFLACTAAYAFSRFRFPGKDAGLMSFLISQMFPGTLMMIPLYILMSRLGLLNSLLGLTLVYSTTSIPFCVWMLKGYFDTIPKEIEEAALMDGASRTLIFVKIILPLARPAIAVTALFSFMTAWNEFILAATFMNDERSYTLPVMLQRFVGSHNTEWGHFAAGAIIVSVPIVLLFFLLQKHLVGGLTAGSVKG